MAGSECDRCGERVWSEAAKDAGAAVLTVGMSLPYTMTEDFLCPTCQRELRNKGIDPDGWEFEERRKKYDDWF